jgi:hypothetical protein
MGQLVCPKIPGQDNVSSCHCWKAHIDKHSWIGCWRAGCTEWLLRHSLNEKEIMT